MASSLLRVQFEPLPAGKTRDEVIHFFDSADGRITDVDLSTDGVAVITFKTADDADKLLKNPPIFDGVQLTARRCSPKRLTAFMGVLDPKILPLGAKNPVIPREATSTPVVKAADETKGSILRRHSENPRTKPKPRVQSCNYPPSKPAVDLSESDDTRSSKVQTLLLVQAQRNLVDVDENVNNDTLCRKDKKLAADSCASPAVSPSSKPRAKSEHEISISSAASAASAVSAPISSPIDIIDDLSTLFQQLQMGHTKEDATAITDLTNADTGVQQVDVKMVTSLVTALIKDSSECSRKVPLAEIAGSLLNKFQSEIRDSVDNELSRLQLRVKLMFNPRGIEIVGSERATVAAEKIIADQYIKSIQEDCLTADDLGGNIEDFSRKGSYEAFIVQQLQEKYRCVIQVEGSSKQDVKADEALRSASTITVVKGDITSFSDADVLVNPIAAETSHLRKAGVVSQMFMKAGSETLQQEFKKAGAPIWFGSDVTVTGPAGTIQAKKIFHPAIRMYRNEKSIKLFTRMISTCLRKAEEENMRSIAFPTVGCGKLQYKSRDVVNCFVEAASGSKLQIYIVAFTDELYEEFRKYLTALDEPDVNQLASTVNAGANTPERPKSVLHIFTLDASTFTKVKEELKCRWRPQPPVPRVTTDVLIEMPIVHPAIAALADEIIRRIQSLQTSELRVTVDAKHSTVTLTGKRKQDIGEVKQRILKLLTEHELQQRNLLYIKKTRGREAYLIALSTTQYLGFPYYWTNYGITDLSKTVETRQPLTRGSWLYNTVAAIVRETWIPSLARLGQDAKNLKHASIEVMNIWVNENPQHYTNYQFKLKSLAVRAAKMPFKSIVDLSGEPELMIKRLQGSVNDLNDQLISEVNEVYLLHGTSHVDEIVKNGIDSRFSGDKVLFGRGAYFAESSTKANQYADQKNRRTEGDQLLYMFLARVLLGEPFLCQEARPDLKKAPCSTFGCKSDSCAKHPMCDSVVGTHRHVGIPLLFREFIVYHPEQCYPEFLVQYKRI